ncbi:MAG: hypothetical protein QXI97_06950, partial [Nitrososphaerota archaeon]
LDAFLGLLSLSSAGVMRAVWKWVQRLPGFRKFFRARYRVSLFLLDETAVIVKGLMAWVWVA